MPNFKANTGPELSKSLRLLSSPRGGTRAKRRAAGVYAPVNTVASLAQAPHGRYAKSLIKPVVKSKAVKEIEEIIGREVQS